jgi:hypothetical protein
MGGDIEMSEILAIMMCSDLEGMTHEIAGCRDHNTEYYWSCDFKRERGLCPRGYRISAAMVAAEKVRA